MSVDCAKVAKLVSQMVPIFNGEINSCTTRDLQTFLGCCKRVISCLTEPEKATFLEVFPTRLRGEAYQLIASNTLTTFEEAERLLNQAYLPRETYEGLVNQLITMRQSPLETLSSFIHRIKHRRTLCKEAAGHKYEEKAVPAVVAQLEDFAKSTLKGGVTNPHLCQYLLTIGEEPFEDIVQKALDMERLQQMAYHTHFNAFTNATVPPIPNNLTQFNAYTNAMVPPIPNNLTQGFDFLNTNQNFPNPTYNFLDTKNNLSIPNNDQQVVNPFIQAQVRAQVPAQRSQNNNRNLVEDVICNYCKIKGHTYTDCVTRKNTPFCTLCKLRNHDAKDCRRALTNNVESQRNPFKDRGSERTLNNQRGSNPPRVYNIRKMCDFCGRWNHEVSQCRQKIRWDSLNSDSGNSQRSGRKSPTRQH